MRLKIVQVGEPVLRQAARPLTNEEIASEAVQRLMLDMWETMRDAPGVGLAAPQIGMGLQLAVIEDRAEYHRELSPEELAARGREPVPFHVIINPTLTLVPGEPVEELEGCLSLAGFGALVPRAPGVVVECLDQEGRPRRIEARGWYARILQHEIDHLRGTLYVDHMQTRTFTSIENYRRYGRRQ